MVPKAEHHEPRDKAQTWEGDNTGHMDVGRASPVGWYDCSGGD